MRLVSAALVIGLFATAAQGAEPLAIGPQGADCTLTAPGQIRTFQVNLQSGHDYAVQNIGDAGLYDPDTWGDVKVVDTSKRILAQTWYCSTEDNDCGAAFHASYTGSYFVNISIPQAANIVDFPAACWIRVDQDCSSSTKTSCTLPVGSTRTNKLFNWGGDSDWFVMQLKRGRWYTVKLDGGAPDEDGGGPWSGLKIRTSRGTVLGSCNEDNNHPSCSVDFRAPATGTFFVDAEGQGSWYARYAVGLKTP